MKPFLFFDSRLVSVAIICELYYIGLPGYMRISNFFSHKLY
ncbi:hypothetical protein CLV53_102345 [Sediminibacterium magnilacihabitans]|nr:hypothetical protein CLV53_102345 [Sediminibacterium magnilacihabitans]